MFKKGVSLYNQGQFSDALYYFDQVLKTNPKNQTTLNYKGLALRGMKKYQEAMNCFSYVLQISRNNAAALNNKGLIFNDLKQYANALVSLDQATSINPNLFVAWQNKADALIFLKKYEGSKLITCCNKMIKLQPTNPWGYIYQSRAFIEAQKYSKAIESTDQAIKFKKTNQDLSVAYHNRGESFVWLSRFDKAILCFEEALKCNPKYVNALLFIGAAHLCSEDYKKALPFLDQVIKISPSNAVALASICTALIRLAFYNQDQAKAAEAYKYHKLSIDVNDSTAILPIISNFVYMQQYETAWQMLQSIEKSKQPQTIMELAGISLLKTRALIGLKKYKDAAKEIEFTCKVRGTWAIPWYYKGVALSGMGRYKQALEMIDKALKKNPNSLDAMAEKVYLLYQLGDVKQSDAYLKKARKIDKKLAFIDKYPQLHLINEYENELGPDSKPPSAPSLNVEDGFEQPPTKLSTAPSLFDEEEGKEPSAPIFAQGHSNTFFKVSGGNELRANLERIYDGSTEFKYIKVIAKYYNQLPKPLQQFINSLANKGQRFSSLTKQKISESGFLCPILKDVMRIPVILADGGPGDLGAVLVLFDSQQKNGKAKCPQSNDYFGLNQLSPNFSARKKYEKILQEKSISPSTLSSSGQNVNLQKQDEYAKLLSEYKNTNINDMRKELLKIVENFANRNAMHKIIKNTTDKEILMCSKMYILIGFQIIPIMFSDVRDGIANLRNELSWEKYNKLLILVKTKKDEAKAMFQFLTKTPSAASYANRLPQDIKAELDKILLENVNKIHGELQGLITSFAELIRAKVEVYNKMGELDAPRRGNNK